MPFCSRRTWKTTSGVITRPTPGCYDASTLTRLEAQIAELLTQGPAVDRERLAELGRLGARLVLQRAVDEEVAAFLSRARYQRTPTAPGSRNGTRPKPIQTAEGEISIAMPQVRNTAERFVSQVIPDTRAVVRTRPLEALIIRR